MKKQLLVIALLLAGGVGSALAILKIQPPSPDSTGHGAAPEASTSVGKTIPEEGPHGGKLLRGDGFEIEVTIFEDDVPPEFRLYAYRDGKPLPPAEAKVALELHRLDKKDRFAFQPREDYLLGDGVVKEPHSFDIVVRAEVGGKKSEWTVESYEGRATISPEFARAGGIQVAQAGPATIQESIVLTGVITPDANRVARVGARFPGVVTAVHKQLGDSVAAGDVLAVVESNESLQRYEIKAPQSGLVTERSASIGAITGDAPLFVLTDLSSVWAELHVFAADADRVSVGLPARIEAPDGKQSADVKLTSFLPHVVGAGQTRVIRVPLDNSSGVWTPGLRVRATVNLKPHATALAVKTSALQAFRDFTVVFAQVGDTYEVRMLELGRTDGDMIEVLGGLDAGERYVTTNSFLVKADAMKSGASHDH